MPTLADSLTSSSARKLRIRKRHDLVARKQHYAGRTYWVLKDPVGLQYFRFAEEEYSILKWLDGETSLDEIKERFERQFPPQKITLEELQNFLGMLHRSGLVISAVPGQAEQLLKRRWERRRREWVSALSNVLSLRFKGFDPERVLNWLEPPTRWMFSPWTVAFCLALMLSALTLVLVQFSAFRARLPEFQQFFTVQNVFWLAVTMAVTKVLHEFGHGLTCKHFGGECHEMGVMLLVLTPCLYCNVSDSWMLPNKWHRAYIGAAGMYVECVLASICTFVWWFTQPGLLNHLCLNTMFIASVSTIIFNANPLLRYDGYYILADLVEIPNLRQKSTTILSRKMGQWLLGLEFPHDPFLPERNHAFFAAYTVAAILYRWLVMVSILLFLYKVFEPYGLKIVGQVLALATLYGLFVYPFYQLGKYFYVPGRLDKVKPQRMYGSLAVLAAVLAAFFWLPLPRHVMCALEIQPRDAAPVYIEVGGKLESLHVRPGERVQTGQALADLRSVDLDLSVSKLSASRNQYQKQIESLRQQRFRDARAGAELPELAEALATVEDQLRQKQADQRRLHLKAPVAGCVFPPSFTPPQDNSDERLATWSHTPLEPQNLGAYFEPGVLFCQVGDPARMEAVLVIDQADVDCVQAGQRVELLLAHLPYHALSGHIEEIAQIDLKVTPLRLSSKSGGPIASKTDRHASVERPMSTSYQARVPLDDPQRQLRIGLRGQGKIATAWEPLARRVWRVIAHTFNFRM